MKEVLFAPGTEFVVVANVSGSFFGDSEVVTLQEIANDSIAM